MLDVITKVSRRPPLTRSLYENYTYTLEWIQLPNVSNPRSVCPVLLALFDALCLSVMALCDGPMSPLPLSPYPAFAL